MGIVKYIRKFKYNIRRFLEELHSIHKLIVNIIVTKHDFVLNLNHLCSLPSAESICTGFGWPQLWVSAVKINRLYEICRPSKVVSLDFGVSVRTPERRKIYLISDRTGSCSTYKTISDERLSSVVREILPDADETYINGACCQRNIFVQRQRIRHAINTADPVSRALRKSICIIHRVYSVPKPNSLW